jgi:hypothetical protein
VNKPSSATFRRALLTTLLLALTATTTPAQLTFSEGFEGGSNEGGWAWGTGNETISPLNGNPGAFLKDLTLSSFLPTVATQLGTSSEFTTDGAGGLLVPGVPGGGSPLTLYLQVIYIDAALPGGYGFSNALSVEFLP